MALGLLHCSSIMQRKIPSSCLLPSVCPFCMKDSEDLLHLFFICPYSANCWGNMLFLFNVAWAFDGSLSSKVFQLLRRPLLSKRPQINWENMSKAMLVELWFERNQRIFHNKARDWFETSDTAKRNAASWCSLNKEYNEYSIQDLCLNWAAFISQPI